MTADLMGNKSGEELAAFLERIESLESEKKLAGEKVKAEFAAAVSAGFDEKAIRQLLKERRGDAAKTIELRAVVEAYRKALARRVGNALGDVGDWARSWGAMENKMGTRVAVDEYKGFSKDLDELFGKGKPPSGKDAASGDGASP